MQIKMVYINSSKNAQKFWHGEILSNGNLKVSWGRVGTNGNSKTHAFYNADMARIKLNKLIAEKRSKGYTYAARESEPEPLQFSELSIEPDILEMIETLEGWLHPWQTRIDIKFDRQIGQLVSPIGNINQQRLQDARLALEEVDQFRRCYSGCFLQSAENYLRLIPLTRKGQLNPQALLGDAARIQEQNEYLDLLESCLSMIWDIRKMIIAEGSSSALSVFDKAQWVEWGSGVVDVASTTAIDDDRIAAIDW